VLNQNPENFFAQIEQAAFSPANFVPGIEPSPDKLLQGRLFSYPDTQRHRLGPNYALIPVNCPYSGKIANYQRDGAMRVDGNGSQHPNYSPNGGNGPTPDAQYEESPAPVYGVAARTEYLQTGRADDFEQAGILYRVLTEDERTRLINNIAGHMKGINPEIQLRQIGHFRKADSEYGNRIAQKLGLEASHA